MADSNSLLSFVAPRYTRDLEDVGLSMCCCPAILSP